MEKTELIVANTYPNDVLFMRQNADDCSLLFVFRTI